MKIKKVDITQLIDFLGSELIRIEGCYSGIYIDNLAEVERVCETTLDWINPSKLNKQAIAEGSKALAFAKGMVRR